MKYKDERELMVGIHEYEKNWGILHDNHKGIKQVMDLFEQNNAPLSNEGRTSYLAMGLIMTMIEHREMESTFRVHQIGEKGR